MFRAISDCEVRGEFVKAGEVIEVDPNSRLFEEVDEDGNVVVTDFATTIDGEAVERTFDRVPGSKALFAAGVDSIEKLEALVTNDDWFADVSGIGAPTAKAIADFLADNT